MTEKQVAASRRRMLIAKLILVFSLSVIFFMVAWTWFSSNNLATAKELSVKTEVADNCVISDKIDGSYYQSLVFYNTSDGAALSLPLISSNGTTFFEPKLDKVGGTYQRTSDNKAAGTVLTDESGKYLVHDIFFKSKTKFSIYLNNDSYVTSPSGFTERLNSAGFSKDYIAAAVRVGVYDVSPTGDETLKYIWCPNSTWQLSQQKLESYTKVSQQAQTSTQIDDSTSQTLPTGTQSTDYYIQYGDYSGNWINGGAKTSKLYKTADGSYYFEYELPAKMSYDFAFRIKDKNGNWIFNSDNTNSGAYSFTNKNYNFNGNKVANGNISIDGNFYLKLQNQGSKATKVRLTFAYGESFDVCYAGGSGTVYSETTEYNVNLVNGSKVLLAATSGTTAQLVSVADSKVTSETENFSANTLTNPSNAAVFTVKLNTDNTYSFLDANDMYFSAKSTGVAMIKTLSNTAKFTLVADGTNILLKTKGGFYPFFTGTEFDASTEQPSTSTYNYTIFAYSNTTLNAGINTNGTIREPKFINNQYSTEQTYSASDISYFTTLNPRDNNQLISNLKKDSGWQSIGGESGYGFAHIRVRIWVEGTDDEAVSLLKDGKFETYLHFVSN